MTLKEIEAEILVYKKYDDGGIGKLFREAKKLIPHGQFGNWIKGLGINLRTAQTYMKKEPLVYFVQRADGLIKIGYSTRFFERLHQLKDEYGELKVKRIIKTESPYELEQTLHKQFDTQKVFGEWFSITDKQVEDIENIMTEQPLEKK